MKIIKKNERNHIRYYFFILLFSTADWVRMINRMLRLIIFNSEKKNKWQKCAFNLSIFWLKMFSEWWLAKNELFCLKLSIFFFIDIFNKVAICSLYKGNSIKQYEIECKYSNKISHTKKPNVMFKRTSIAGV